MVEVRPFADADYPALVRLQQRRGDGRDEATWRRLDADDDRPGFLRLLAERDGTLVGWAQLHAVRQAPPGTLRFSITPDPDAPPDDVQRALFTAIERAVAERAAAAVQVEVKESDGAALDLYTARGFREVNREWESHLDVTSFDVAPYAHLEQRVATSGITITTFADERRRAEAAGTDAVEALQRAVHALEVACARDDPSNSPDDQGMPYEAYVRFILGDPGLVADGYFLATDGPTFVGISNLFRSLGQPGVLKQGLTGVLPAYRRRGIATALKLRTVRYAREHGYRQIRTRNNTQNQPMLRRNEAMGFVKEPAWVMLERHR